VRLQQETSRTLTGMLPGGETWEFWDKVVSAPASLTLLELKDAADALDVKVGGMIACGLWIGQRTHA